jgi:hypothetical protein
MCRASKLATGKAWSDFMIVEAIVAANRPGPKLARPVEQGRAEEVVIHWPNFAADPNAR